MNISQIDRLKAQLLTSGLSQKDSPLFQIINSLIDALRSSITETNTNVTALSAAPAGALTTNSYLTENDDTADLPNSRRLLAGTNITFDDTIPGERTVDASGGGGISSEWSVLTNGDLVYPELIFVGGDVVMLHTP